MLCKSEYGLHLTVVLVNNKAADVAFKLEQFSHVKGDVKSQKLHIQATSVPYGTQEAFFT